MRKLSKQAEAELERLSRAHKGRLTPPIVWAAARNQKSPLHSYIKWRVDEAARLYQLDQAAELIRAFKITVTVDNIPVVVPKFVSDPSSIKSSYIETLIIREDPNHSRAVLLAEFARIAGALKRARALASVFDLSNEVEAMLRSSDIILRRLGSSQGDHHA